MPLWGITTALPAPTRSTRPTRARRHGLTALGLAAAVAPALAAGIAACGQAAPGPATTGHINVVAAEGMWGSIAAQLGGAHVSVVSVVTNPNADPHEYAGTTNDARAVADADYVVLNGAGYDDWCRRLVDANPSDTRSVLDVAALVGRRTGDNPHVWYSPSAVTRVADRITADYRRLDPADAAGFDHLRAAFGAALSPYRERIAGIASTFGGRRVAATENVVLDLADALHLTVVSPPEFMKAVAEGNDPPAQSVAAFQSQLTGRAVSVLVYNVQTATAVTTALRELADQEGIPTVGVSETLQPPGASFQDWQVAQLDALRAALARGGTG